MIMSARQATTLLDSQNSVRLEFFSEMHAYWSNLADIKHWFEKCRYSSKYIFFKKFNLKHDEFDFYYFT